jgi:ribosomal protein L37AE/L43A
MIANLSEDALEDGCLMCVRLFTRSGPLAVKMLHEALRKTLEEENERLGVDFTQKGTVDWSHPLTAVASLPNNSSKRERDVLYKAAVDAIYIVKMLKRNRDFWEPLNEEPKADFGKLLTRLAYDYVLVTACNSFCVQDCSFREFGDLTKLRLATVGAGIAPVSNVLQHSCDANVARVFVSKGGVVVGRANKYVKAGDQLELAFGMHYHSKARQERREFLSKMRFFECECPACVGDWQVAEVLDAMDPVFKCPECGATVSKDVARNVEEFANVSTVLRK